MSTDIRKTQTIDPDIVQRLRDYKDGKISTGELGAELVAMLRQASVVSPDKAAWIENKLVELDIKVKKHDGVFSFLTRFAKGKGLSEGKK